MKSLSDVSVKGHNTLEPGPTYNQKSRWRHSSATFTIAITLLLTILLLITFAPLVSAHKPQTQDIAARMQGISWQHPLGTDPLGRDVWARLLYGGRFSLRLSLVVVLLSALIGMALGMVAGRLRGWVDALLLQLLDFFTALPGFAVALVLAALLRPSFWTLALALTTSGWLPFARLARAVGLELNSKLFMEAAQALGGQEHHILMKHVLPHTLIPITATALLRFGHTLLMIAGLSFLGLGAQPPTADWGLMLAEARPYMQRIPLLVIAPGLGIFITSLCITLIGQHLMQFWTKR